MAVWTPGSDAAGTLVDCRIRVATDESGLGNKAFLPYRAAGGSGFPTAEGRWGFPEEDFSGLAVGRAFAADPDNGMFAWLTSLRNRRREPLLAEVELGVRLDRPGSNRRTPAAPCIEGSEGSVSLWSEAEDPADGRLWSIAWAGRGGRVSPEIGPERNGAVAVEPGRTNRRFKLRLEPGESASLLTIINERLGRAADSSTARRISERPGPFAAEWAGKSRTPIVNFAPAALAVQDGAVVEYLAPAHFAWVKPAIEARVRIHNPELVVSNEHSFLIRNWVDMFLWNVLFQQSWSGPLVSDYAFSWTPGASYPPDGEVFDCLFLTGDIPQQEAPPGNPQFTIDRSAPQAGILSPLAGAQLNADTVTVSFEGHDNLYVRKLSLEVDGRAVWENDTPGLAFMSREREEGSWAWSLRQERIGAHTLTVRVEDGAGWTNTETIEVQVAGLAIVVEAASAIVPLQRGRSLFASIRFSIDNPRRLPVAHYRILRRISGGIWNVIKDFPNPSLDQISFVWFDRIAGAVPADILYKIEALDAQGGILGSSPETTVR